MAIRSQHRYTHKVVADRQTQPNGAQRHSSQWKIPCVCQEMAVLGNSYFILFVYYGWGHKRPHDDCITCIHNLHTIFKITHEQQIKSFRSAIKSGGTWNEPYFPYLQKGNKSKIQTKISALGTQPICDNGMLCGIIARAHTHTYWHRFMRFFPSRKPNEKQKWWLRLGKHNKTGQFSFSDQKAIPKKPYSSL